MGRDLRVRDNHALLAAQKHALALKLPLAVVFCLSTKNTVRAREHYNFMITGLKEVEQDLKKLCIPLIVLIGPHLDRLNAVAHHYQPALIYTDFNPLRGPQKIAKKLAESHPLVVVDTHNIVPVWHVSQKQEFAARTVRPKIHNRLTEFLQEPEQLIVHPITWSGTVMDIDTLNPQISEVVDSLPKNNTIISAAPGESNALLELELFITYRLRGYSEQRNNPTIDGLSNMSPYLHFGQIASLRIVLRVLQAVAQDASLQNDADTLIEELVVRKELSDNYCYYNDQYDSLSGAASWARATLAKHAHDDREYQYSLSEFEHAKTHDPAWNAAQKQLLKTGKIHGYMRMYWAKKVLEWSASPEDALRTLLYLNDFYSIDGGDPNGYVGILWSIAGLHDRPWGERPVYGTIRSMVYSGLKRKFDIAAYETMWL
jgi:deoxyribodipyrimidine photo-lyase